MPRRDHVQGTVPAEVQRAVRGADGPDRAGGDELPGGVLPCDDGARVEGPRPDLLLYEPEARLRGDVLEPVAA